MTLRSTTQRGYGAPHQKLRKHWKTLVGNGDIRCARCGGVILPHQKWHLDHANLQNGTYLGPSHARCNQKAGGKLGAALTNASRKREYVSRLW